MLEGLRYTPVINSLWVFSTRTSRNGNLEFNCNIFMNFIDSTRTISLETKQTIDKIIKEHKKLSKCEFAI